jgi:hypothetical protein
MLTHEPESFLKEAKPISPKSSYSPKKSQKLQKEKQSKMGSSMRFLLQSYTS